jgi:hypothetical protein
MLGMLGLDHDQHLDLQKLVIVCIKIFVPGKMFFASISRAALKSISHYFLGLEI